VVKGGKQFFCVLGYIIIGEGTRHVARNKKQRTLTIRETHLWREHRHISLFFAEEGVSIWGDGGIK